MNFSFTGVCSSLRSTHASMATMARSWDLSIATGSIENTLVSTRIRVPQEPASSTLFILLGIW